MSREGSFSVYISIKGLVLLCCLQLHLLFCYTFNLKGELSIKIIIVIFIIVGGGYLSFADSPDVIGIPLKLDTMRNYLNAGPHTFSRENFYYDLSYYLCSSLDYTESLDENKKAKLIKEYIAITREFLDYFKPYIVDNKIILSIQDQQSQEVFLKFFNYFGVSIDKKSFNIKNIEEYKPLFPRRRNLLEAMGYNVSRLHSAVLASPVSIEIGHETFSVPNHISAVEVPGRIVFLSEMVTNKKFMLLQCALSQLSPESIAIIKNYPDFYKLHDSIFFDHFYMLSLVLRTSEEGYLHYPGGKPYREFWLQGVGALSDDEFLLKIVDSQKKQWFYLFRILSLFDDAIITKIINEPELLSAKINVWIPGRLLVNALDNGRIPKDSIFDLLWVLYVIDEGKYLPIADKLLEHGSWGIKGSTLHLESIMDLASVPMQKPNAETTISQFLHLYSFFKIHPFAVTESLVHYTRELLVNYHNAFHYLNDLNFSDESSIESYGEMMHSIGKITGSEYSITMRNFQSNLEFLSYLSRNGIFSSTKINELLNKLVEPHDSDYTNHLIEWCMNELLPAYVSNRPETDYEQDNDYLLSLIMSNKYRGVASLNEKIYRMPNDAKISHDLSGIVAHQNILSFDRIIELWKNKQLMKECDKKERVEICKNAFWNSAQIIATYKRLEIMTGVTDDYLISYGTKLELNLFQRNVKKLMRSSGKKFSEISSQMMPLFNELLKKITSETLLVYSYLPYVVDASSVFYYEKDLMRKHQLFYDPTFQTLSGETCNAWLNTFFSSHSSLGNHYVNSLYGIKIKLPVQEAQDMLFAHKAQILNENITAMPLASLALFNQRKFSEDKIMLPLYDAMRELFVLAKDDKALLNKIINESFYVVGNQKAYLLKQMLVQAKDAHNALTPSETLFLLKRLSSWDHEGYSEVMNKVRVLLQDSELSYISYYLPHALINSFNLAPSYETSSQIDSLYLSERLIDTRYRLAYYLEKMNISSVMMSALLPKAEQWVFAGLHQDDAFDWKAYLYQVNAINESLITQWIQELIDDKVLVPDEAGSAVPEMKESTSAKQTDAMPSAAKTDKGKQCAATDPVYSVKLLFSVTGKKDKYITDLNVKDIDLLISKKPVSIEKFEVVDPSLSLIFLVDISTTMTDHIDSARTAAINFINETAQYNDKISVISFNDKIQLSFPLGDDRITMIERLSLLKGEGGTSLYDSILNAKRLLMSVQGQKAIIILSDGKDENSLVSLSHTLEILKEEPVPIFAIGFGDALENGTLKKHLEKIASISYGLAFFTYYPEDIKEIYNKVTKKVRVRYAISFAYPGGGTCLTMKKIKITIHRPDCKVHLITSATDTQ